MRQVGATTLTQLGQCFRTGGLTGVLVPKLIGWAFVLPIHLFEGVPPSLALRASDERTSGRRVGLAAAYVGWALGGALSSAVAFGIGAGLGRWLVAMFQSSMLFLPVVMGGLFLLASLLSFALTWVQAAFFVLLTLRLYQPEGTSLPSLAWIPIGPVALTAFDQ